MVNKTTKVKAHTRTSKKTGKTTAVKEHTMRYDASDIAKEALLHKKVAGNAIKARFDAAAKELASLPDPKDMSDEDVKSVATPKKHKPLMKRGTKAWNEKHGKDPNFARDLVAS